MTKPFALDRRCTCTFNRFSECVNDGWHEVDAHDTAEEAIREARMMDATNGVPYRARERSTGRILE